MLPAHDRHKVIGAKQPKKAIRDGAAAQRLLRLTQKNESSDRMSL